MRYAGPAAVLLCVGLLGGCFNGDNDTIRLGDVSIGQQMIDLQRAVEQGALTQEEFERVKAVLISFDADCESGE